MSGRQVVDPTDSSARGSGLLRYNHHTFNYALDLLITGVEMDDLLGVGPNNTPIQLFIGGQGENGDLTLDPGFYTEFEEVPEGLQLTLDYTRLGGEQGNFESNIFETEDALYDGRLYIQLFTVQYPDGEIRGQLPRFQKFLGSMNDESYQDTVGPPTQIPAPGVLTILVGAAAVASRRRR